jgi:hypothetical protein
MLKYELAYGTFSIYRIEGDRVTLGRFRPGASGTPHVNEIYYSQYDGVSVDTIKMAVAMHLAVAVNVRSKGDRYREAYRTQ